MRRLISLLVLPLLLTACWAEKAPAPSPPPEASASGAVAATYPVKCGCSIKAIGHCGEYAIVDDQPVQLVGELGLGKMPFCGKRGLSARIRGELKEGKLEATSIELVK